MKKIKQNIRIETKEAYVPASMEIIRFENEDIITTSGLGAFDGEPEDFPGA